MKIFKRIRGFLRSRIPFLKKKKNGKEPQINKGFEDFDGIEMYEDVGEDAHAELNAPVPSENPEEEHKSDTLFNNEMDYNERPNVCSQFQSEANVILDCPSLTKVLDNESSCNIGMTPNIVCPNKDVKQICTESIEMSIGNNNSKEALLPAKDLGNKNERTGCLTAQQPKFYDDYYERLKDIRKKSVEEIGQILRRNIGMTSKIGYLNKGVKQICTESVEISIGNNNSKEELLPAKDLGNKNGRTGCFTTQQPKFCEDYNERLKDMRKISVEKTGQILGSLSNPDKNDDFEVDFDAAFGPNMQTFEAENSWPLTPSKKVEVFERCSEQYNNCLLALDNDKEMETDFDAFFQMDRNISRKIDSFDGAFEIFPDSTPRKEDCEKFVLDDNYIGCFSNGEKPPKNIKKQKMKVVIRDRPLKNPVFEKLFLFSDVDNELYLREIKDPMKRKYAVRSDITEFKHVPAWDSRIMKKYYSDGDLLRAPPDFSMAFTNVKK